MTNPHSNQAEQKLSRMANTMLRALFERHDALGKDWHGPVYGKKIHVGDKCAACGTNFAGLREDIERLFKYYAEQYAKAPPQPANTLPSGTQFYKHHDCDKAIVEGRLDDACDGCKSHPTTPMESDELPSVMEMMVEIKKYWTTANGEPELKEFAEYVLGIIRSHTIPKPSAAQGDDWLHDLLEDFGGQYEWPYDYMHDRGRSPADQQKKARQELLTNTKTAIQGQVEDLVRNCIVKQIKPGKKYVLLLQDGDQLETYRRICEGAPEIVGAIIGDVRIEDLEKLSASLDYKKKEARSDTAL